MTSGGESYFKVDTSEIFIKACRKFVKMCWKCIKSSQKNIGLVLWRADKRERERESGM